MFLPAMAANFVEESRTDKVVPMGFAEATRPSADMLLALW